MKCFISLKNFCSAKMASLTGPKSLVYHWEGVESSPPPPNICESRIIRLAIGVVMLGCVKAWVQNVMKTGIKNLVYVLFSPLPRNNHHEMLRVNIQCHECNHDWKFFQFFNLCVRKFAKYKLPVLRWVFCFTRKLNGGCSK